MLLVIGYGNGLRRDDGLGPEAARRVAARRPEVQAITAHQLLPEHAAAISTAARVAFVDATAAGEPGAVTVRAVAPDEAASLGRLHDFAPGTLLAYALLLYGHAPPAAIVTAAGFDFGHGEGLSPGMAGRLEAVVTAVEGWLLGGQS